MKNELLEHVFPVPQEDSAARQKFLHREWLLTNGLGGYSSGTIGGGVSRRYHGLLIAALPASQGRVVMFNHLSEAVRLPSGERAALTVDGDESVGPLREVRLEYQLPVWQFVCGEFVIEKRILLVSGQNTVHVTYVLVSGPGEVELELRPSFQFRPHEADVGEAPRDYEVSIRQGDFEVSSGEFYPPLRMALDAERKEFCYLGGETREVVYAHEAERGYRSRGQLWTPGYYLVRLTSHRAATLTASTESWETLRALKPERARAFEIERRQHLIALAGGELLDSVDAELTLSADQFIISPTGRVEDTARARAVGDEVRTVIAGYHWFTDWGRDTMISLEGLTLATGRHHEAGWILRTFANHIRDGLIPNLFPEGESAGLYHTADATLWFFHAVDRYVSLSGDHGFLRRILPKLQAIVAAHVKGTHFGIRVDPDDGLLSQGAEGYQLTWMDAKVDGWVVTPRRGKAVEINALWYQALRLMEGWLREAGDEAASHLMEDMASRVRVAFNARFWNEKTGHLFDVVDGPEGDDAACRPNQIFAFSLRHAVLAPERWEAVLHIVREKLLTPYGLRSLSPDHPDYKSHYFGDLRARDAAYHQGTVWAWLIGPFVDAWLKVHPERTHEAREFLIPLATHLEAAGLSSISEIFDAEAPFHPRGCIAQAWSVAEVLRCRRKIGTPSPRPGEN